MEKGECVSGKSEGAPARLFVLSVLYSMVFEPYCEGSRNARELREH